MTDYTNLRKIVTGDIVVKCRLGNDIRRIPISQVPTYDELCLMMYRVFKKEIKDPENIVLKYTDNEGDLISLTDDVDIDHAISISNLLKVTIFDKTSAKHMPQLQLSLIEIRDNLNELIKSFDISKKETIEEKANEEAVEMKQTRKLTPAELASFDTTTSKNNASEENSSVKELTTLSPKAPTSAPYYPPISQPQQPQYQPSGNSSANSNNKPYIQTPLQQPQHVQSIPPPQTPQQSNVPVYPPPTAAPLQQHPPQQFNPSVPSYPLPQVNNGVQRLSQPPPTQQQNQPHIPPQQQQQNQPHIQPQQQRPIYYNNPPPPHPSGSVSTPQAPPQQQFRPPPSHW